jgi:DNA helicase II / ATP-dependent DNA helicase PcrA
LRDKQAKGRAGSKAAQDRERAIASTINRLEWLATPRRFTYNPNGDNFGADSLSHSEVLKIAAAFILSKPSMQAVLINKYPFLLIDESQDTNRNLVEALFSLATTHVGRFALGLFGDTMQRIYADGHPDLGFNVPAGWARPVKRMNHRSPRRIVQLGNALRAAVDGQKQMARDDSELGVARLFVVSSNTADKPAAERRVRDQMSKICGDAAWNEDGLVKTLTLEHHMAASRRGFLPMFQALDSDSRLATGLRKGDLAGLRLFTERVEPLLAAAHVGDRFAVMAQLRKHSPLLKRSALANSPTPDDPLGPIRAAVADLVGVSSASPGTRFLDVLECTARHGLFDIPAALSPFVDVEKSATSVTDAEDTPEEGPEEHPEASLSSLRAWRAFLETPYIQVKPFAEYVSDKGPYGTHQGVKGLEFERVLVVLDDSEAKGFMFSYERLLGAKPSTETAAGGETGIDRTRRLLYVTCTRAQKSLALVAYTENPDILATGVQRQGWFAPDEIVRL